MTNENGYWTTREARVLSLNVLLDLWYRFLDSRLAKIIAVLVLLTAAVFTFLLLTSGDSREGRNDNVSNGPVVSVDENGQTVVSNIEGDGFEITFIIPQNCAELTEVLKARIAEVVDEPAPEQTRLIFLYQSLAEDLCTTRQFRVLLAEVIQPYNSSADGSIPEAAVPPAGPGSETENSGANPNGSPTEPSQSESGVTTGG